MAAEISRVSPWVTSARHPAFVIAQNLVGWWIQSRKSVHPSQYVFQFPGHTAPASPPLKSLQPLPERYLHCFSERFACFSRDQSSKTFGFAVLYAETHAFTRHEEILAFKEGV